MRIPRREFIGIMGASMAAVSAPQFGSAESSAGEAQNGETESIEKNGWRLKVTPAGQIVSFTDGSLELVDRRLGETRPRVVVAGMREYRCDLPSVARRDGATGVFRYDFSGRDIFSVKYEAKLLALPEGGVALEEKIGIEAPAKITDDVLLALPRNLHLPVAQRNVFVPMKNGTGRRKPILGHEGENEYVFATAGTYKNAVGRVQILAIPMVDEYADQTDLRLTHCADPYFTSYFSLAHGEKGGEFNCAYSGGIGIQREDRLVYTALHRGGEKGAMQSFYATALAGVQPGPDWLHEVAMVDYDFLSKNGRGWFSDIDALERLIAPEDRAKVFLALHGWYDTVGHYAFDWRKQALLKEWTAFTNAASSSYQSLPAAPDRESGLVFPREAVKTTRPVPMSIEDMHRRVRYAKKKGFRVGIYYADGINGCDGVKEIYDPSKVLRWGGWEGPDTKGKTYAQNPLHPEVREFYLRYIRALLDEYGKEVDGFVWDETFTVGPNDLGPAAAPGYASRGMMTLIKEVAAAVAGFSPQLAFLASDDIGAFQQYESAVPYCLVAHGTYQDMACTPSGWSYGLFPNYRNVLWSCNWWDIQRFDQSRYGVETFNAPVPISNGYGDYVGIGDMTPAQQKQFMDLFHKRKQQRMDISWIEEEPSHPKYKGKEVEYEWFL